MFTFSSLVGGAKRPTQLEFTPIGKRGGGPSARSAATHVYPAGDKVASAGAELPRDSPAGRFDSTFSIDGIETPHDPAPAPARPHNPTYPASGENARVVSDGASLIQTMQNELRDLLSENYNLKVEVATLKQYLRQTPLETRDLALENAKLKQELIGKNRQADTVRDDVLARVEYLENDNQALRRQLQDAAEGRGDASVARENELKTEVHRLKSALALVPPDAADQLHSLATENEVLARKLKLAQSEASQLADERDSFSDELTAFRREIDAKNAEIARLREQVDSASADNLSADRVAAELQAARHEAADLELKLNTARSNLSEAKAAAHAAERTVHQKTEELENTVRVLTGKLSAAKETLREKDHDNYELRAEVRSLMDERNTQFDSQATARHYQAQIDKLRQKETSMRDEMSVLRTELAEQGAHGAAVSERERSLCEQMDELHAKLEYYEEQYGLLEDAKMSADNEVALFAAKVRLAEERYRAAEERLRAAESELQGIQELARLAEEQLRDAQAAKRRHNEHTALLEKEIETLRARLRRSEVADMHRSSEHVLYEHEQLQKRREDAEKTRIAVQNDELQAEVQRLERQLARVRAEREATYERPYERRDASGLIQRDVDRLTRDVDRLTRELEDRDHELRGQRSRTGRLQAGLADKDLAIDALESRVRELNRDLKHAVSSSDGHWTEVARLQTEHEQQLRSMRLEHEQALRSVKLESDAVQRGLRDELRYSKTQADAFAKRDDHAGDGLLAMVSLLEIKVEQAQRASKELAEKLCAAQRTADERAAAQDDAHRAAQRELVRRAENLQSQLDALRHEHAAAVEQKDVLRRKNTDLSAAQLSAEHARDALQTHLDELQEKLDKAKAQLVQHENNDARLTAQVRKLQSETDGLRGQLSDMQLRADSPRRRLEREQRSSASAEALKAEIGHLRSEKSRLDFKARNLSLELDRVSLACVRLAHKVKEMEVGQYSRNTNEGNEEDAKEDATADLSARLVATDLSSRPQHNSRPEPLSAVESRFMMNKILHNKIVANETLARCDDLRAINSYAQRELLRVNGRHRADFSRVPSVPRGKLTLRAVAYAVLGAVRLRRLGEKALKRRRLLEQISHDIARDKSALIRRGKSG